MKGQISPDVLINATFLRGRSYMSITMESCDLYGSVSLIFFGPYALLTWHTSGTSPTYSVSDDGKPSRQALLTNIIIEDEDA